MRNPNAKTRLTATALAVILATTPGLMTAQEALDTSMPAEPPEGMIEMQDVDSVLVSDLMAATVYNTENETVGKITDVIVTLDGTVEGAIIGVGGFLGIGRKDVAVEMDQFAVDTDESGIPRLVLDTSLASLETAPEFFSAREQAAQAEQERARQEMEATPTAPPAAPGTESGVGAPPAPGQ